MTFCCSVGSTPGEQLMLVFLIPSDANEREFSPAAPGVCLWLPRSWPCPCPWAWAWVVVDGISVAMALNLAGKGVILGLNGNLAVKMREFRGEAKVKEVGLRGIIIDKG